MEKKNFYFFYFLAVQIVPILLLYSTLCSYLNITNESFSFVYLLKAFFIPLETLNSINDIWGYLYLGPVIGAIIVGIYVKNAIQFKFATFIVLAWLRILWIVLLPFAISYLSSLIIFLMIFEFLPMILVIGVWNFICLLASEIVYNTCEDIKVSRNKPFIGPSGGYVFYDKGTNGDGWRYLEAAPSGWSGGAPSRWSGEAEDTEYVFGYHRFEGANIAVGGTETGIGSGKKNTQKLVAAMESSAYNSSSGSTKTAEYAAKVCAEYRGGGHDDWFLPSRDELNKMYRSLKKKNMGSFFGAYYWSSSEVDNRHAWYQTFKDGSQYKEYRTQKFRIRPVRAF